MSKSLNISVLVAARDEYIEQLKCIVVPMLIQGFNSIYQDAIKLSENKRTIWKFQELLKQIPQWNQTILQEESKRIKKKCPYIMDIVTAIFVTNVKILASVRLKGSRNDIRVKIPTSDIFIHSIYIESAHQIFYDPFLFHHKNNHGKIQENKNHVKHIIEYSVEETIRQMLPFDDILQKYLADALNDNAEFGDGGESDSEEGSICDSDQESINLPSDESEDESEPDEDQDKVKSFQLENNGTISRDFIADEDDSEDGQLIDEPQIKQSIQQEVPMYAQQPQQVQPQQVQSQPDQPQLQPVLQQSPYIQQSPMLPERAPEQYNQSQPQEQKYSFF